MTSIPSFTGNVTGTTGTANTLEAKASYRVYALERGAFASAASSGALITFDSADAASRFVANDWIQIGTNISTIRQVTAVGGNSIGINSAVTVALNDRIFIVGQTQPSTSGGSATYTPSTTIYQRDDDASTPVTNSMLTTDSNGAYQVNAAQGIFDLMVQDSRAANVGFIADQPIGIQPGNLIPDTPRARDIGSPGFPWDDIFYSGRLASGVTSAAGVTSHRFDTIAGVTQGNLWQFGNSGTMVVYGDTMGGVHQSWNLPQVFNVKSARFGAKGDGTTDDTTAIQAAITAATGASDGAGGIVYFPPGIYIINSALTITNRVRLVGSGDRIMTLRAGGSFSFNGTTDAMIVIGSGANAYATVEEMQIDCNNIANSIGVYSAWAQEKAGLRRCTIVRFRNYGVYYASGCQQTTIENCEFFFSASSTTAYGIYEAVVSGKNTIRDCTFNSYDGVANSTNAAVLIDSGICSVYDCHVEHHAIGFRYINTANGVVVNCQGHSSVTSLVQLGNGVMVLSPASAGGTNVISDTVAGVTITSLNAGGWYMRSNDGSVKDIWTSIPGILNYHGAPTSYGTTLTADAAFGVSGAIVGNSMTILTQTGGSITLAAGYFQGISGTGTNVTAINPLTNGRMIMLQGVAGAQIFADGAGLDLASGTNKTLNAGERMLMHCIGSTWYQSTAIVTS